MMLDGDVELHDEQTILYLGMDWPDPPEGDDDEPGCLEDEIEEAKQAWRVERRTPTWEQSREEVLQVAAVAIRALRDAL